MDGVTNVIYYPLSTAPSTVPIMHQVRATMKSITLSWPQPEQPNGIILDYEIRFYEKVRHVRCAFQQICSFIRNVQSFPTLNSFVLI